MIPRKVWLWPVLILGVLALGACGGGGGGGGSAPAADTTGPVFSSMVPAPNSTGASLNTSITMTFNESLDCSDRDVTLTNTTTSAPVSGASSCSGKNVLFNPTGLLDAFQEYSFRVAGVADTSGNVQASPVVKTFTTGAADDTVPPEVNSTNPADNATNVARNAVLTATFNEALDPATVTTATFTLTGGISGTVSYSGTTATFTPNQQLAADTSYTATLSAAITDLAGNHLAAAHSWSFTTAAGDTAPPGVVSTTPADNATFVNSQTTVSARFNEALDGVTVDETTFTLSNGAGDISGTVTYNAATFIATFTPDAQLAAGTYAATLTSGITDEAGNPLATDFTWVFTVSPPALTASPNFSVSNAVPGDPVDLTLNVTSNAYEIIVCLEPKPEAVSPAAVQLAATVEPGGCTDPFINSAGNTEIPVTVNIPATAIFDDYYPSVVLTEVGSGDPLESFYQADFDTLPFYTERRTDTVTDVVVPFLVVGDAPDLQTAIDNVSLSGTDLTIDFTVRNAGLASAGASSIEFFVDPAQAPEAGQTGDATASVPALGVGQSSSDTIVISGVSADPSIVFGLADSTGIVAESNEENNAGTWVNLDAPVEAWDSTDPLVIPNPGSVDSTLQVNTTITDPRYGAVSLDITHTFDEDLIITLISPSGTEVILSNRRGGSGDNYTGTVFHDGASTAIADGTAPFTGEFIPEEPLATFAGEDLSGTWTLRIEDVSDFDTGTLEGWSLLLW